MRAIFTFQAVSTGVVFLWMLFLFTMYPVGVADGLFGNMRPELAKTTSFEKAKALTSQLSEEMTGHIQIIVLLVGVPFAVISVGWSVFAGYLLFRKSVPEISRDS